MCICRIEYLAVVSRLSSSLHNGLSNCLLFYMPTTNIIYELWNGWWIYFDFNSILFCERLTLRIEYHFCKYPFGQCIAMEWEWISAICLWLLQQLKLLVYLHSGSAKIVDNFDWNFWIFGCINASICNYSALLNQSKRPKRPRPNNDTIECPFFFLRTLQIFGMQFDASFFFSFFSLLFLLHKSLCFVVYCTFSFSFV